MKQIYFVAILVLVSVIAHSQVIDFPDSEFRLQLCQASTTNNMAKDADGNSIRIDTNNNFQIEVSEALTVYRLTIGYGGITNLSGIEYFTNLTQFRCQGVAGNGAISTLDVRALVNLQILVCSQNNISNLLVDGLANLRELYCSNNNLTTLNLNGLTSLKDLYCSGNVLQQLDLTMLPNLLILQCQNNDITNLAVSGLDGLIGLLCNDNQLTSLDVSTLTSLVSLYCSDNNLTQLDLSGLSNLARLSCNFNELSNLNLEGCTGLVELQCYYNQLQAIDVSNLPLLQHIRCMFNQIQTIDLTGLAALTYFSADVNQLNSIYMQGVGFDGSADHLFTFDQNPELEFICVDADKIELLQNQVTLYGYTDCEVSACELTRPNFTKPAVVIAPNPVADILRLSVDGNAEISIYNTLGQLVVSILKAQEISTIDVSNLKPGNYFIKINSDKGTTNAKFAKN